MAFIRTPLYSVLSEDEAVRRLTREDTQPGRELTRDDYLAKLIKYIPAEAIAVFSSIVALGSAVSSDADTRDAIAIAVALIFLAVTPTYFWMRSRSLEQKDQPVWYFYVLSSLSFAIWSLAVSGRVRESIGINAALSEFMLALGAFLIPFFDELLTTLLGPKTDA